MAWNRICLTPEKMRAIARYEMTFKEIVNDSDPDEVYFECSEPYRFTLDDLHKAVLALKEADPSIGDFGTYWLHPLNRLASGFGLDKICRNLMTEADADKSPEEYPGLLLTDRDLFTETWMELETAWEAYDEEEPLSEAVDFDQMLAGFERFLSNRGKPVEECSFSKSEIGTTSSCGQI